MVALVDRVNGIYMILMSMKFSDLYLLESHLLSNDYTTAMFIFVRLCRLGCNLVELMSHLRTRVKVCHQSKNIGLSSAPVIEWVDSRNSLCLILRFVLSYFAS